jgi:transcriptional regulator with XRE-family HTH domain
MTIEVANKLVELRKKSGLSQDALADKLGVSRQAVSKWERAESSPDTDNLICLAKIYGVSLDELLKTDDTIEEIAEDVKLRNEEDEENKNLSKKDKKFIVKTDLISGIISLIGLVAYIVLGSFQPYAWTYGWVLILLGPIVGSIINMIHFRDLNKFPIALICVVVYILLGFLSNHKYWHPGWIIFLLIPIYHSIVKIFDNKD